MMRAANNGLKIHMDAAKKWEALTHTHTLTITRRRKFVFLKRCHRARSIAPRSASLIYQMSYVEISRNISRSSIHQLRPLHYHQPVSQPVIIFYFLYKTHAGRTILEDIARDEHVFLLASF